MPGVTAGNRRLRMFRSRDDTHVHPGKEERDVENRSRKQFGPFVFDEGERILWRDDQSVPLTPKASDLLAAFLESARRLLSKDELLKTVWPDTFVEESNLAYHVFALRKALGDGNGNGRYIETVPKRGYRFTADVSVVSRVADAGEPGPTAADTEVPHASDELHPVAQYADRPFPFSRRLVIVALVLARTVAVFRCPVVARRALRRPTARAAADLAAGRRPCAVPVSRRELRRVHVDRGEAGQSRSLRPSGGCRRPAPGDDRPGQRLQPELVARWQDDRVPAARRRRESQRALADRTPRRIGTEARRRQAAAAVVPAALDRVVPRFPLCARHRFPGARQTGRPVRGRGRHRRRSDSSQTHPASPPMAIRRSLRTADRWSSCATRRRSAAASIDCRWRPGWFQRANRYS